MEETPVTRYDPAAAADHLGAILQDHAARLESMARLAAGLALRVDALERKADPELCGVEAPDAALHRMLAESTLGPAGAALMMRQLREARLRYARAARVAQYERALSRYLTERDVIGSPRKAAKRERYLAIVANAADYIAGEWTP